MDELQELIFQIQLEWGKETVLAIKKKIRDKKLRFEGTLENSVDFDIDSKGKFVFDMEDYGAYLDEGVRGWNGGEGKFQFAGNWRGMAFHLKKWASAKGIVDKNNKPNPYGVAYSIQQKGLKPRRFFNDVIAARTDLLGEGINEAIADYMDTQVNKANNTP